MERNNVKSSVMLQRPRKLELTKLEVQSTLDNSKTYVKVPSYINKYSFQRLIEDNALTTIMKFSVQVNFT